jgi:hypothetical protein
MLVERGQAEICRVDPGFGDDLVVTITDPLTGISGRKPRRSGRG